MLCLKKKKSCKEVCYQTFTEKQSISAEKATKLALMGNRSYWDLIKIFWK